VHVIEIALAVALPVQLWGPLSVIRSSALTLPVNWSKGAANESTQSFSVTLTLNPTSDDSQCSLTFQVPLTSGHASPPAPAAPDSLLRSELELQASSKEHTAIKTLGMIPQTKGSSGACEELSVPSLIWLGPPSYLTLLTLHHVRCEQPLPSGVVTRKGVGAC